MKKTLTQLIRAAVVTSAFAATSSVQALTLPAVSACSFAPTTLLCYDPYGTGVTEIYVASRHDDFISYSVNALQQLTNSFGYTGLSDWSSLPSFGSGQIVKLFTFNNANNSGFPDGTLGTNDNPGPSGDQTPPKDDQYLGEWPSSGIVTVGEVEAFLGTGLSTPVFSYDLNNNDLLLNGFLEVRRWIDQAAGTFAIIDTFAFDNDFNSNYDEDSLVPAQAEVTVPWFDPNNTSSGCTAAGDCSMVVKNSVGSGKPDFFAYAPSFDLTKYQDSDFLYFKLYLNGLDGGGEELALTNLVGVPGNEVPEPGVLALLGLALAGLGVARRLPKRA